MTTFYRFESAEQFLGISGHTEMEFDLDGISVSVIGLIADGEVDGEPTYINGWHVNASKPVAGWEDMQVTVNSPLRVFG
jgi:hypothetical protein